MDTMKDPRGLWEIPEVRAYLCRWAQFAGLSSSADADALKIDVNMCGSACQVRSVRRRGSGQREYGKRAALIATHLTFRTLVAPKSRYKVNAASK